MCVYMFVCICVCVWVFPIKLLLKNTAIINQGPDPTCRTVMTGTVKKENKIPGAKLQIIYSQNPPAGSEVPKGSVITLEVV